MKSSKELEDVFKLINNKRVVSESDVPNVKRRNDIQHRINQWIKVSLGEWHINSSNSPYNIKTDENHKEKYRCKFCNAPLTSVMYYAVNNKSGQVITLGSECVKKLGTPEFMASQKVAKNSNEQRRYEQLLKKYPDVDKILGYGKFNVNDCSFLVPKSLEDALKRAYKSVKEANALYLRKGKYVGKSRNIHEYTEIYNGILAQIDSFEAEAERKPYNYLSKDIVQNENRLGNDKIEIIVHDVRENEGILNTRTAQDIIDLPFLKEVAEKYNEYEDLKNLRISANTNSEFHIFLRIDNHDYGFLIQSKKLIATLGYPIPIQRKNVIFLLINSLKSALRPDGNSSEKLLIESKEYLLTFDQMHNFDLGKQNIWINGINSEKSDWISEKYKDVVFFEKDKLVYYTNKSVLIDLAKNKRLKLKTEEEIKKDVKNAFDNPILKNELFRNIRESYEMEKSFL